MKIGELARSAHVAWSPSGAPGAQAYLAAGTASGTLSADFDTSASLELIPIQPHGGAHGTLGAPLGRVQAPSRFTGTDCPFLFLLHFFHLVTSRGKKKKKQRTKNRKIIFFCVNVGD